MLLRLAYLGVTNVFALLRLLPVSDRDKDAEILALRHQVTVLERQMGNTRPRFSPADRAFLTALLHRLPRDVLGQFQLLVQPDTVLRWHRGLLACRHAARWCAPASLEALHLGCAIAARKRRIAPGSLGSDTWQDSDSQASWPTGLPGRIIRSSRADGQRNR